MAELGLESMVPMDRLSVFGLIEPLKRLPELCEFVATLPVTCVIFSLNYFWESIVPLQFDLEKNLRQAGITAAHLVSPSVWAWRSGRVKQSRKRSTSCFVCCRLNSDFMKTTGSRRSVLISVDGSDRSSSVKGRGRAHFAVPEQATVVACLPGSRAGEWRIWVPYLPMY